MSIARFDQERPHLIARGGNAENICVEELPSTSEDDAAALTVLPSNIGLHDKLWSKRLAGGALKPRILGNPLLLPAPLGVFEPQSIIRCGPHFPQSPQSQIEVTCFAIMSKRFILHASMNVTDSGACTPLYSCVTLSLSPRSPVTY